MATILGKNFNKSIKVLPELLKHYNSEEVLLNNIYDAIIPVKFPKAKKLIALNWEKNSVFYNLNKEHFPNVKEVVFLCAHPFEFSLLSTFDKWTVDKENHHIWFDEINQKNVSFESGLYRYYDYPCGRVNIPNVGVMDKDIIRDQFRAFCRDSNNTLNIECTNNL